MFPTTCRPTALQKLSLRRPATGGKQSSPLVSDTESSEVTTPRAVSLSTADSALHELSPGRHDGIILSNQTANILPPEPKALFPDAILSSRVASNTNSPSKWPQSSYEVSPHGSKKVVRFIYDPDIYQNMMDNLTLIGSWDNKGRYSTHWTSRPMHRDEQGRWIAEVELTDDGPHPWEWGVLADAPAGKQKWAVFQEGNLKLDISGPHPNAEYAPTRLTYMGVTHQGENVTFRFWAPNARSVKVVVWGGENSQEDKPQQVFPLTLDPQTGVWSASVPDSWSELQGKSYAYEVTTSEGEKVLRIDPYARVRQGQQRGLDLIYIDPSTGKEVDEYTKGAKRFLRFEVQDQPAAQDVYLRLIDGSRTLSKNELIERLGGDKEVESAQRLLARFYHPRPNDYWLSHIDDEGRIHLTKRGQAWTATVADPNALTGLRYRFEVIGPTGDLIGDTDHDGTLSALEARKTPFNDPYSDIISDQTGWPRYGIITEPSFPPTPHKPELQAPSWEKKVIYELHIGSIFGAEGNAQRSTIKDVINRINYFKELGITDVELLPTDSVEKVRDWGYAGSSTLAKDEKYGFVDENGKWVSGREALRRLVDAFHEAGIAVHGDVVYNHWGGRFNDRLNLDGQHDPVFNWGKTWGKPSPTTPWGPMPAYNKPAVKQFIIDHAVDQFIEYGLDGLRFDFTHPIHAQDGGGGTPGWEMLREINRQLHFFFPQAITAAEEFPNHPIITTSPDQGGAGFDQMWNTQFNHTLIHDSGYPSILQQASQGSKTNMDRFMNHLIHHPGFSDYSRSVTVINNHDEVGNADRIINIAGDTPWGRKAARTVFGVGILSPGTPIFFQGAESLATNKFRWGVPSTWDVGWEWLKSQDTPTKLHRYQHFLFSKDVIQLKRHHPAFDGDAPVERIYTHNDNSVAAFKRFKDGEEFLVVFSLNHQPLPNYTIPNTEGRWELELNSDDPRYGGDGVGRHQVEDQKFDLPAGGLLVYKKVS